MTLISQIKSPQGYRLFELEVLYRTVLPTLRNALYRVIKKTRSYKKVYENEITANTDKKGLAAVSEKVNRSYAT